MATKDLMRVVEESQMKPERGAFGVGDTVDVYVKIVEGEKERVQIFTGVVIGRKGKGVNESFTVRRLVGSEGVERVFPVHSPSLEKVEVKRHGKIRRAKLYFLRNRIGKATRLSEKRGLGLAVATAPVAPATAAVKPRVAGSKPESKKEKEEQKA